MTRPISERGWIDISVPIRAGMVRWPGDPPVVVERAVSLEQGGSCNLTVLAMSAHTGTHVDAPLHYLAAGCPIDAMPLEATNGPARVIQIRDPESIKPRELLQHRIRRGERLLFRTRGSAGYWQTDTLVEDFVSLSKEAAEYLAARRVRAVGIDYLSIGGLHKDLAETHRILLAAGVWIIEGLDLSRVRPGRYDLVCLPLRLAGADAAPARAMLRPR